MLSSVSFFLNHILEYFYFQHQNFVRSTRRLAKLFVAGLTASTIFGVAVKPTLFRSPTKPNNFVLEFSLEFICVKI
jgi:hypothetical protein